MSCTSAQQWLFPNDPIWSGDGSRIKGCSRSQLQRTILAAHLQPELLGHVFLLFELFLEALSKSSSFSAFEGTQLTICSNFTPLAERGGEFIKYMLTSPGFCLEKKENSPNQFSSYQLFGFGQVQIRSGLQGVKGR